MSDTKSLNTPHVVTVGAPLLRPGLTISATCSERYAAEVAKRLMSIVREINTPATQQVLPEKAAWNVDGPRT